MKKTLLIAALCMQGSLLFAQKNTLLVGGNINYNNEKQSTKDKISEFTFSPVVGYQFNNNWTAGAYFDLGMSKENPAASGAVDLKNNFTGAGPFIRYAKGLGSIFAVYGQLQGGFTSGKAKAGSATLYKTTGFETKFFPAFGINVHNGLALNVDFGGISYSSSKVKGTSGSTNSFDFNFGQNFTIGISKNFSLKKK